MREKTDAFKREHEVESTPQVFIGGQHIGGYDKLPTHLGHPPPGPDEMSYMPPMLVPSDLPTPPRVLSRGTHWLFYAILIVLPVLGWVAASGYGANITRLGLVPLPALVSQGKGLAENVGSVHGALAWALLAVIALHVSGALYHASVKQDGVLNHMLQGRG